jgi:thymidylate synthase
MRVILIVAISKNRVIGKEGKIPWYIPEDLKIFRKKTQKTIQKNGFNVLFVGPKTYKNIKCISQKKRRFFIVKNDTNIKKIIGEYRENKLIENLFVIGGEYVYKRFLNDNLVDEIHLTFINKIYDGNRYFPRLKEYRWELVERKVYDKFRVDILKRKKMEYQYIDLVEKVLFEGENKGNTKSIFSPFIMKWYVGDGTFPLLTTKKMFLKGIIEEFRWICNGIPDVKILQKKGVKIWDANTNFEKLRKLNLPWREFDAGPIYPHLLRNFGDKYKGCDMKYNGFDQLKYVINELKTNSKSRRILFNLWDPSELKNMSLPPCHILYNFNVINEKLSLLMYQRSGDIALGIPFNIASGSLFLHVISKIVGIEPYEFIHVIGDAHIYKKHINGLLKQIKRKPFDFPKIKITGLNKIDDIQTFEYKLINYKYHEKIGYELIV